MLGLSDGMAEVLGTEDMVGLNDGTCELGLNDGTSDGMGDAGKMADGVGKGVASVTEIVKSPPKKKSCNDTKNLYSTFGSATNE